MQTIHMNDSNTSQITACRMLGFVAHPGSISQYLDLIKTSVESQQAITVYYHNLHSLYAYFTTPKLRACYDRAMALVDGMPVIWLLGLGRHTVSREQRVTYVDFIWPMLEQARDNNWRVYHLGQSSDIQQQAIAIIREKVPGIIIDGHDGYFNQEANHAESLAVIDGINAFSTDLLLVGFGAPRQEYWVDAHRDKIKAPALFTCGACMEYVAGAVKTPPRWMGRTGLEWSYRLFENPRRFAFRYLVEPVILGAILFKNLVLPSR